MLANAMAETEHAEYNKIMDWNQQTYGGFIQTIHIVGAEDFE